MTPLQTLLAGWRGFLLRFVVRLFVSFLLSPWFVLLPQAVPTCLARHVIPYPSDCIMYDIGLAPLLVFGSFITQDYVPTNPWPSVLWATVLVALIWTAVRFFFHLLSQWWKGRSHNTPRAEEFRLPDR
jgi:hypothetical protein